MSEEHTDSADTTTDAADEAAAAAGVADEEHASDAWHDVIGQLDALGEAMGCWARAAVNDPVNRERADELKDHMNKMADTVSGAIDDASRTDVGQQFKDAAYKTGEAFKTVGGRVSEEVAPRVASAFRITAEKLHQAAERMERPAEQAPEADAPHADTAAATEPDEPTES